jgi:hypothetical protein
MAPIDWLLVVSTGIGGLFGLFCLFDGARRVALYGANSASGYLIGIGAVICLALAGYAYWQADLVDCVMWLVWGAAALAFGTLFAREPAPQPVAEPDTITIVKIEPVLAPPVAAQAPPKPVVGFNTIPLAKPAVGGDTVPLPKPAVGADTVPLPKPAVGSDTVPLPKPGVPSVTIPLAKPAVGEDTVPLAKPAPGTFSSPPKKE